MCKDCWFGETGTCVNDASSHYGMVVAGRNADCEEFLDKENMEGAENDD